MDQQPAPAPGETDLSAPRLTVRSVVTEAAQRFFDIDRGWLRTARDLTFAPGAMIRRYVEGQRKIYANPFAYLVLGTAVSIMVQRAVGFQDRMVRTAHANTMDSPLQMEFVDRVTGLMSQNALFISIGILVPLALFVRLFFRRSGYNLAECFVFALYSGGHLALLGLVLVPLYMLLPPSAAIQGTVGLTVAIIYTAFVARGFFSGNTAWIAIKTGLAYVMAYCVFMIVTIAIFIAYVFAVLAPQSSGEDWDLITATDYEAVPVIKKLLDEGADVDTTLQRTSLHAAAANGSIEIVELLIERGADVNLQDIHGRVPIFVALAKHQTEIARRLSEEETDVGIRTNDGSTLLMAAVRAGDAELVRWALDRGTDVNAVRPKKDNATALMMAAEKGDSEIVKLLLAGGADPKVTNHEGRTALDLAKGEDVKGLLRASTP